MRTAVRRVVACVLTAALLGMAAADFEVTLPNKSKVAASFGTGAEAHGYTLTMPAGARFGLSLKPAKGGPALHATLFAPDGSQMDDVTGPKLALKNVPAPASGKYAVVVSSADGATVGAYTLVASWKSLV
jgi:hypothetical protein